MRIFVYKTTCNVNGKYYIGVHTEHRESDGYIGCGVCSNGTAKALKRKGVKSAFIDSVIKYGYENFTREILQEFKTIEQAYEYEANLVDSIKVAAQNCLNIRLGGAGGVVESTCKPIDLIEISTGKILNFKSRADCARFLGVTLIGDRKKFVNGKYMLKGTNVPIALKRFGEEPIYFYDISAAKKHTGLRTHRIQQLINHERKSASGWFLANFDFNSSFYKHAKAIRKRMNKTSTKLSPSAAKR
jgi:hypothetical protein